jgi:hypothetical protein
MSQDCQLPMASWEPWRRLANICTFMQGVVAV